jgi:hypothetical protein
MTRFDFPTMKTYLSLVERLEQRIAPATFVNPTTVTYFDSDGDLVTVHANKAIFDPALTGFTFSGGQLERLVLGQSAAGVALTFTAKSQGLVGDGHVDVGAIDATGGGGVDLGAISIDGDLGQIDAGDGNAKTPGLKSLKVQTLGGLGLTTQGGVGDLVSTIQGPLGALVVAGDLADAKVETVGATAKIGSIRISGSLVGGSDDFSGAIIAGGDIGNVTLGGSVLGGSGNHSGWIETGGKLANVTIGGSVIGGGQYSGGIVASTQSGKIAIGGDVKGGSGFSSGEIDARINAGITISGSVIGGSGPDSGEVAFQSSPSVFIQGDLQAGSASSTGRLLGGNAAKITIGGSILGASFNSCGVLFAQKVGTLTVLGDVVGGSILGTASATFTGGVFATSAGKIFIGGSVIAGTDMSTGTLGLSGAIGLDQTVGSLVLGGSLEGNITHPAQICAGGYNVRGKTDLAIKSLLLGGHGEYAMILAGSDSHGSAVDSQAQIGSVSILGDWIASSIVAGIDAGGDGVFGNGNDSKIATPSNPTVISKISQVTIGGRLLGTGGGGDQYAFEAQQIGSIKVGLSSTAPLTSGLDDFNLSPSTGSDVRVREFA